MPSTRRSLRCLPALAALGLVACGGGGSSTATSVARATPTPTPKATPRPTPTPAPTPVPLQAPVIIQVENSPLARPQSGISQADIVYEYETEGGITRFSTFWFHAPPGTVGPVRSARIATFELVQTYNATLLYSGAGNYVEGLLGPTRHYSEGSGALYRTDGRAAPHNLYTDGPHVAALAQQAHGGTVGYQLWARTGTLPLGGIPAPAFTVPISTFEQPHFTWDRGRGGWARSEPTGPMIDANSGQVWAPPTVVVLPVPVVTAPEVHDVTGALGVRHTLAGTGPAQIFTGGFVFNGRFSQGPSGPPGLTLANGAPAPIAPGEVLVILIRQGTFAGLG